MKKFVYNDCETQSETDLKKRGTANYFECPTTELLCWGFVVGDEIPWMKTEFNPYVPGVDADDDALYELACDEEAIFVGHNAYFERRAWKAKMVPLGFPDIPRHRWKCTLAKAQACGLPASLDMAAKVMSLSAQKDLVGHKLMLKWCKPKRDGTMWKSWDNPEEFEQLCDYCLGDIFATRQLDRAVPDLSPNEQSVWEIDQRINDEGIYLDLPLVRRAISIGEQHKKKVKKEFGTVTGESFSPRQRAKFRLWLEQNGVIVADTKKTTLEKVESTDWFVTEAIRLVGEANKSSLAKYPAMIAKSDCNGRARELLAYHSAHTGRWGGRGIQVQNLAHTKFDMETLCEALEYADHNWFSSLYPDVPMALSSGCRGMIIPPEGHDFLVGDYNSIEARALAWLAGQDDKVDDFRRGADPYCVAASGIYLRPISKADKDERAVGKVSELSLGYEGGIAAAIKMSVGYRVDLSPCIGPLMATASDREWAACAKAYLLYCKKRDEIGDNPAPKMLGFVADLIKQRWREKNDKIVLFWHSQQAAAILAVKSKRPVECGFITWFLHGGFLHCRLPTGRDIRYPFPQVKSNGRSEKLSFMTIDSMTHQWKREDTYGGKLTENIVQALCRDIMVDAMQRLEKTKHMKVTFSVHDELIVTVPKGGGDEQLQEFLDYMRAPIECLPGLPLSAEGFRLRRYQKL